MEQRVQLVSDLAARIASDPALASQIKENPVQTLQAIAAPLATDVWIYRMVVGALGLGVLVAMIGAIFLAMSAKPIPEVLVALGSAAIGALAGLLAPSPAR